MLKSTIAVVVMTCATSSIAFAGQAMPMEEARMGDRWTYSMRDEITGETKGRYTQIVTDVGGEEISVRQTMPGKPDWYLVYDLNWNMKSDAGGRYSPNDGQGVRVPLSVGDSWSRQLTRIPSSGGAVKVSRTSRVVGEETVTTPAGRFEAFQIEITSRVEMREDPTKKGTSVLRMWYSPAINHWVKRVAEGRMEGHIVSKSSEELIAYGRRE